MPIQSKLKPMRFTPKGLVDAFDSTDKFPGACTSLANLIFDQSNPEFMISRPGVPKITAFPGFSSPGIVSVFVTIGSVSYGLIATARNSGKDEPFAYDHAAAAFIAVGTVTNANTPTTQAGSGPWTPPTIASVGVYVIVTHPGFAGSANKFGWFDLTNPAAPTWNAGDTVTNALPSIPVAVANFNNRAYFACANSTPFTDVLSLTRTAATQALTMGDTAPITALSGLPIQTTSSGVVQALIIWKDFQCWQVTGDPATPGGSNLAQNYISLTIGCSAPRSIAQSPLGIYFMSFAGPFVIDQFGILRALVHDGQQTEPDIQAPFENAVVPSRMAAGYCGTVYRVCMETVILGADVVNDYWFDEHRRRWTGPHSFPYDCTSQLGNYFVLASNANPGALFKSEINPGSGSVYTDNGVAIVATLKSSTFPKTGEMIVKQVCESTIELASAGGAASYQITGVDDIGNTLNSCQVSILPAGALWSSAVWGAFNWASSVNIPTTYTVPWTAPLVFKKMAINIIANAGSSLSLGTFYARYKEAGYTNVR